MSAPDQPKQAEERDREHDDLLIGPTDRLLETAGIQVVSFAGDTVVAVHCYYDDLALFEQLITSL